MLYIGNGIRLQKILPNQFGAAIDMLENAIRACPDSVWGDFSKKPEWKKNDVVGFWHLVFHTLFFLDYHLMHHVQHHTAQLNLILRQKTASAPDWVSRTKAKL